MSMQNVEVADDTMIYNPTVLANASAAMSRSLLPKPGYYKIRVLQADWRTDRDGNKILNKKPGTQEKYYPQIAIERIEILEPEEDAAKFYVQDSPVMTLPYKIKDRQGSYIEVGTAEDGQPTYLMSAGHVDMLRALSESEGEGEHFDKLWETTLNAIMEGTPFVCSLGLFNKDKEWANAEIDKKISENGGEDIGYSARKNIWDSATYKTQAFKNDTGGYNSEVTTPEGVVLPAKLKLGFPVAAIEADRKVLGPYQNKR